MGVQSTELLEQWKTPSQLAIRMSWLQPGITFSIYGSYLDQLLDETLLSLQNSKPKNSDAQPLSLLNICKYMPAYQTNIHIYLGKGEEHGSDIRNKFIRCII